MNLTEKILHLDRDALTALKNSKALIVTQKQELDTRFEELQEIQERSFENQKSEDIASLTQKLEREHQKALSALEKKKERFTREFSVDRVVEQLLSTVRDQACH